MVDLVLQKTQPLDDNVAVTGTLNVTGISTFTGAIDANGGATIDNIQCGVS